MSAQLALVTSTAPAPLEDEGIRGVARADRHRAVALVVQKYRGRLYHHALYILKDSERAYDVVQEVFIKAIREPRFFDEGFRMKAWLYRVTSNLCFNTVRDKRRRGAILEAMPQVTCDAPEQLDALVNDERQQRILEALEQLSDDHRRILMLRYYSDLSYAEIADALEIKLGTVMSRLSRAKGNLLEVLGDAPLALD